METARGAAEIREPTKLEGTSARRVAESKATIPHLYLDAELQVGPQLEPGDLKPALVKAVASALRERPALNGAYRDGRHETYSRVNVGIALAAADGPLVPTIFDADTLEVDAIAAQLAELDRAAAEGALTSPQLAGGTFTVIVAESPAVTAVTPVINGAQAGTLAAGGLRDAPVLRGGDVVAGRVVGITLACDSRVIGAAEGGAFLEAVKASFPGPR